jgi:hypothetical protein
MIAQEAGDFSTAWSLARSTSSICLSMQLHKRRSAFASPIAGAEAYYCFALCYINDKGLAMNLGRTSFLPDREIEVDILENSVTKAPVIDNFYIYLSLARIQSLITDSLTQLKSPKDQKQSIERILVKMKEIWALKVETMNN